ncbi:hypothetical protein D3C84_666520 [compost metagenome]
MQSGKSTGQLEPGAAADTPDPTTVIEVRAQLRQGPQRREIALALNMAELFRPHPPRDGSDFHHRRKSLLAQRPAHADRHLPHRAQGATDHHRLAGNDRLDHPGRRVRRQLLRVHAPQQVVSQKRIHHCALSNWRTLLDAARLAAPRRPLRSGPAAATSSIA